MKQEIANVIAAIAVAVADHLVLTAALVGMLAVQVAMDIIERLCALRQNIVKARMERQRAIEGERRRFVREMMAMERTRGPERASTRGSGQGSR